jgi:outer membrane protein TolC
MKNTRIRYLVGSLIWFACSFAAAQPNANLPVLTLDEAVRLALDAESVSTALDFRASSFESQAAAAGQLPDPKLKIGLANFPTDTFSRSQEAMTQLQLGVVQSFPRGHSRAIKSRMTQDMAEKSRLLATDARLKAQHDVTQDWLELYYWLQAEQTVQQSRSWFRKLVGITESRYRVGSASQQDVVQAGLELDRLAERIEQIHIKQDMARAELSRWIGDAARRSLPRGLPGFPEPDVMNSESVDLKQHPLLQSRDAEVSAGEDKVDLARQAYKPGWALDVTYGDRSGVNPDGGERADFLSAKVLLDIPLFTSKRQDQALAASQHELEAVRQERETLYREIRSQLQAARSSLHIQQRQIVLYQERLVPQSHRHAELSLHAYENNRVEFNSVVLARIAELDTRLKALRLEVDRASTVTKLAYLVGGAK